jgi:hypothetical protein
MQLDLLSREQIEQRMDQLAIRYGETHDPEVLAEMLALARQLRELKELYH